MQCTPHSPILPLRWGVWPSNWEDEEEEEEEEEEEGVVVDWYKLFEKKVPVDLVAE